MTFLFRRADRIAASLTRFARSAPEKPGDWRATPSTSTFLSSGLPLVWTLRIATRPFMSGRSRMTCRSKRPGRRSAGSRTSGRFVAATTITFVFVSKPSISTRIWLRVCSRSSCEPPRPAPRWRPTASISSTKTMHGEFRFAWSNRSRTRRRADADEHLDELGARDREERHAGLAGHGPGHQRLAGARRPDEEHAARDPRAERVELLRVLQELDDFLELGLRLVDAGHVAERHDRLVAEEHPGPALAEREGLVIGPLGLAHHEEDEAADDEQGQQAGQEQADPATCRAPASPRRSVRRTSADSTARAMSCWTWTRTFATVTV